MSYRITPHSGFAAALPLQADAAVDAMPMTCVSSDVPDKTPEGLSAFNVAGIRDGSLTNNSPANTRSSSVGMLLAGDDSIGADSSRPMDLEIGAAIYATGIDRIRSELRRPLKVFALPQRRSLANAENLRALSDAANVDYHRIATSRVFFSDQAIDVYANLNMQLRMTGVCNQQCPFCIEQFDRKAIVELPDDEYVTELKRRLDEFNRQGICPSVTITGGEPLVRPERLKQIILTLMAMGVQKFNINTNGVLLLKNESLATFLHDKLPYLNISLHHWDPAKNRELAGNRPALGIGDIPEIRSLLGGGQYGTKPRIRLQVVLQEGYIHCRKDIEEYLNQAAGVGIDNVAVRGPSVLAIGQYEKEVSENLAMILDSLAHEVKTNPDGRWEFICQNVADWYVYEDWKFFADPCDHSRWIDVHFNFSDMQNIRRYEENEMHYLGRRYGREFVLFETGEFSSSWNKDNGLIPQ